MDAALKRLGDPREVAETIVWLASERASYVRSQTILVDGTRGHKGLRLILLRPRLLPTLRASS